MKISKKLLRRARRLLEPLKDRPRQDWEGWLTAAAVQGLSELEDQVEWTQPPPARTAFAWVEGAVMLGFRPEAPLHLGPSPSAEQAGQARDALTRLEPPLQESLRCLGLKALEGNLSWRATPRFEHLEEGEAAP